MAGQTLNVNFMDIKVFLPFCQPGSSIWMYGPPLYQSITEVRVKEFRPSHKTSIDAFYTYVDFGEVPTDLWSVLGMSRLPNFTRRLVGDL